VENLCRAAKAPAMVLILNSRAGKKSKKLKVKSKKSLTLPSFYILLLNF